MARSRTSFDFILGFVLLLVVLSGIVVFLVTPQLNEDWRKSSFQSICDGRASYYRSSELYNSEKKNFASNAKAFEFLLSDGRQLRVVGDYGINPQQGENSIDFTLFVSGAGGEAVDVSNLKIRAIFSDGTSEIIYPPEGKLAEPAPLLLHFNRKVSNNIANESWEVGLEVSDQKGSNCLGVIPLFFSISPQAFKSDASEGLTSTSGLNASESGVISVKPGLNHVGFSDWILLDPIIKEGIAVLSYDSEKAKWVSSAQSGSLTAQPGRGYFLYNPSDKNIKVGPLVRYKVPSDIDSHKISTGWNLLYNDTGKDASLDDINVSVYQAGFVNQNVRITKHSLKELIKNNLASSQLLVVGEDSNKKTSTSLISSQELLSGKKIIPQSAVFWFYLFEKPLHDELTSPDISLTLEKTGDSFKSGDLVHLTFKVKNNDKVSHFIDAQSEFDFCQMGLTVTDSNGEKIYDDRQRSRNICPLWPKQVELLPSQTLDFTHDWLIPDGVKGEVIIHGYFDYTRLGSSDIIESEQSLKVSDG